MNQEGYIGRSIRCAACVLIRAILLASFSGMAHAQINNNNIPVGGTQVAVPHAASSSTKLKAKGDAIVVDSGGTCNGPATQGSTVTCTLAAGVSGQGPPPSGPVTLSVALQGNQRRWQLHCQFSDDRLVRDLFSRLGRSGELHSCFQPR